MRKTHQSQVKPKKKSNIIFGANVRRLREDREWSIDQFDKMVGFKGSGNMSRIENGQQSTRKKDKIADLLGVTVAELHVESNGQPSKGKQIHDLTKQIRSLLDDIELQEQTQSALVANLKQRIIDMDKDLQSFKRSKKS
jgi:transcriptional regulator with XRE-family HTH domain